MISSAKTAAEFSFYDVARFVIYNHLLFNKTMSIVPFGGPRLLKRGWLSRIARRLMDIDERYALFTVVAPLAVVCYATVYVGCIAMDRQKELRWLRVQSLSKRQHELDEERQALEAILSMSDDEYEFKAPP